MLPVLYPPAPTPTPLTSDTVEQAAVFRKFSQYVKNNYAPILPRKKRAFSYDRIIDKYRTPMAGHSDIVPRLLPNRLPEELTNLAKGVKKPRVLKKKTIAVNDLPDEDSQKEEPVKEKEIDEEAEEEKAEKKALEDPDVEVDEDEDEAEDEELDVGTDYYSNYFDNGEGYLDSDGDGEDEGPVY